MPVFEEFRFANFTVKFYEEYGKWKRFVYRNQKITGSKRYRVVLIGRTSKVNYRQ